MRICDIDEFRKQRNLADDCVNCNRDADKCSRERFYSVMDFCEWLDDAPPFNDWILDRNPDDLAEVIVTWINHNPAPYYEFTKDKPCTAPAVYYKNQWYWYSSTCADILAEYGYNEVDKMDDGIEVIAWKEFPAPYSDN